MRRFAILLAAAVGLVLGANALAHHNGPALPNVPHTPAIRNIWADGDIKWCLNNRASNYPNFRANVTEVFAGFQNETGITFVEVAYNSVCEYRLDMPDDPNFCSWCAARIFYANWPVTAQFKWTLGYPDWRSAIAHETGHLLGLHEQYDDVNSICLYRPWTVMSCGAPQVSKLQQFDLTNIFSWLLPPRISQGGLAYHEGRPFIWYGYGETNTYRADQVAVFYHDTNAGVYYWSGLIYPVAYSGYVNQETWVYCYPGREIWVNQQISGWPWSSWLPWLRNDTYLGRC